MNKEECLKAVTVISEYIYTTMFTSDEYVSSPASVGEAVKLFKDLIDEHFPKKVLWLCDDEPLCPSCHSPIDDDYQDLCEYCNQRLDWSDTNE